MLATMLAAACGLSATTPFRPPLGDLKVTNPAALWALERYQSAQISGVEPIASTPIATTFCRAGEDGGPRLLFLHGADEADKTRVLVRNQGRRSMVADGAWRLRAVPGMLPARADQLPLLPFVLVSPQLPRKVRGFSDASVQAELRRLVEEHLAREGEADARRVQIDGLTPRQQVPAEATRDCSRHRRDGHRLL